MAKRLSTRNIRYILTPEGMNELAHRSYHYMRRTFTEVQECAAAVKAHIMQAKALGIVGECADSAAAETLTAQGCISAYDVAEREYKVLHTGSVNYGMQKKCDYYNVRA